MQKKIFFLGPDTSPGNMPKGRKPKGRMPKGRIVQKAEWHVDNMNIQYSFNLGKFNGKLGRIWKSLKNRWYFKKSGKIKGGK